MLPTSPDGWTLVQEGLDAARFQAWETLFAQGSGYLQIRGSLEEHFEDAPQNVEFSRTPTNVTSEQFRPTISKWGTFVPGVYGQHPLLHNELINLPGVIGILPFLNEISLRALVSSGAVVQHRELRLADATIRRSLVCRLAAGTAATITFERFISAARPALCVQRMTIVFDGSPGRLRVESSIDADVRTNGYDHLRAWRFASPAPGELRGVVETDSGTMVTIVSRLRVDGEVFGLIPGDGVEIRGRTGAVTAQAATVAARRPVAVEKRTAVSTTRDRHAQMAEETLVAAGALTFEQLHAEHAAAWRRRWEACDVIVEGHPESQFALRMSAYHLLRSHVDDPRVAIDPKGYTSDAYWGRFFWDTEMCLLPFYLYTQPEKARTLVDFRVNTLGGALDNARRYGYDGARYAWESDGDGRECCPNWQYADHEIHITADVVYGLAHYAAATGDDTYLRGPAARVIVETARYWMQRVDWKGSDEGKNASDGATERRSDEGEDASDGATQRRSDEGEDASDGATQRRSDGGGGAASCRGGIQKHANTPVLLGVMGPDEYTPISSNNAFTNRMVRFALELAARIGDSGGATDDERCDFAGVAARLPIPRDPADPKLVLQCDEFPGLAEPRFERFWKDRAKTFASQVSQERLYRSKCLKQADVLMLMMLFPHEFSDEEAQRAWEYYLPYTTHDSSLSPGVHALVACRLGRVEEAWRFWEQCCAVDLDIAAGGAREGMHIANCGLIWQIATFGFAGVRTAMQCESLTLAPRLPAAWRRLRFPLVWKGQAATIDVCGERVEVTSRSARPMSVTVWGESRVIAAGESATWTRR